MKIDFNIYLITDRHATTLGLPEAVRLALKGGVRAVQLREKDLPVRELLSLARELRGITREFGAKLFINDRAPTAQPVDLGFHFTGDLNDGAKLGPELLDEHADFGGGKGVFR